MSAPDLLVPLRPYQGRGVLLACSGGADSVAMLRALIDVRARVRVAHFDHGLRPESGEDARWVAALADALGVPVSLGGADVGSVADARGWNLEDAARRLRYEFLARTARTAGLTTILTAHTASDQVETLTHEFFRGEHALLGIPARQGHVERPWLGVPRSAILAYLRDIGQDWREDPTNADPRFTRNWLRHEVLPLVRSRFPSVDTALLRQVRWRSADEAVLDDLARRVPDHAVLALEPEAVLRRYVAARLREARLGFHAGHVDEIVGALREGGTRHFTLPGGRSVVVTDGKLVLASRDWPLPDFNIPSGLTLRHRLPGDRIRLNGGTRKVSDVLTDRKVPRPDRDRVWLVADGQDVRWLGLDPPVWAAGEATGKTPWWDEMGRALVLAGRAAERGEVPVGAVVVCDGAVVAEAHNTSRAEGDMTCHAELIALRNAARTRGTPYLTGCTLVVTLEPCPMCLGAAIEARVDRVVFGADNPKLGALGGVGDLSRFDWGHRLAVVRGVRAAEAGRLLRAFFHDVRGG